MKKIPWKENFSIFMWAMTIFIGMASLITLQRGIYLEMRPEFNINQLKVESLEFSKIKSDSVLKSRWLRGRRSASKDRWERILEVHFENKPIYLSYSSNRFDVHYRVFSESCWKLHQDPTITIWYKGYATSSEKYRMKSVIDGSQIAQIFAGSEPIYTQKDLLAVRMSSASELYKLSGVLGVITILMGAIIYTYINKSKLLDNRFKVIA